MCTPRSKRYKASGEENWLMRPNNRVNLSVSPVTPRAKDARAVPVQPAGYAER